MSRFNRRDFLVAAGASVAVGGLFPGAWAADNADYYRGLKVGLASYSVNKLSFDEMAALVKDLGLRYVSLKEVHLSRKLSKVEIQKEIQKLRDVGVTVVSGGVIYLKGDEATMRSDFEYARNAGMQTMVVSFPRTDLAQVEKLAKEFDIKVAIHNHGPGDQEWPSVLEGMQRIKNLDARMGFCVDFGHAFRQGENEIEVIKAVGERLFECHFKDYKKTADGKFETRILGEGDMNLKGILKELLARKYQGHIGVEYEKTGPNAPAELKACFSALRKMLAEI